MTNKDDVENQTETSEEIETVNAIDDTESNLEDETVELARSDEEYEEVSDEETTSVSSKILRTLVVLAVGGGLALWGGPKVAPMLPAGLKPVSDFLAPQSNAGDQISKLRTELEQRIAGVESELGQSGTPAEMQTILDELSQNDAQAATSMSEVSTKLDAMQSNLDTLQTEFNENTARLAVGDQGGSVSDEAMQQFQQKLAEITAAQQKLSQSQDMALGAQKDAESKLKLATANTAISTISDALESGEPFQEAIDSLTKIGGFDIPESLTAIANTGITPAVKLRAQFPNLARDAIRQDAKNETNGSLTNKFTSFLKSQVGTRSLAAKEGDTTDAILSRVGAAINAGNIVDAASEVDNLNDQTKEIMSGWISSLQQLNGATLAVDALQKHLKTVQN